MQAAEVIPAKRFVHAWYSPKMAGLHRQAFDKNSAGYHRNFIRTEDGTYYEYTICSDSPVCSALHKDITYLGYGEFLNKNRMSNEDMVSAIKNTWEKVVLHLRSLGYTEKEISDSEPIELGTIPFMNTNLKKYIFQLNKTNLNTKSKKP